MGLYPAFGPWKGRNGTFLTCCHSCFFEQGLAPFGSLLWKRRLKTLDIQFPFLSPPLASSASQVQAGVQRPAWEEPLAFEASLWDGRGQKDTVFPNASFSLPVVPFLPLGLRGLTSSSQG